MVEVVDDGSKDALHDVGACSLGGVCPSHYYYHWFLDCLL